MVSRKKDGARKDSLKAHIAIAAFIFIALAFMELSGMTDIAAGPDTIGSIPETRQSTHIDDILARLFEHEDFREYNIASFEELSIESIRKLSVQQPVIYGGLPEKTLYRAILSNGNESLLAVYDAGEDKILRQFAVVEVQVGQ